MKCSHPLSLLWTHRASCSIDNSLKKSKKTKKTHRCLMFVPAALISSKTAVYVQQCHLVSILGHCSPVAT